LLAKNLGNAFSRLAQDDVGTTDGVDSLGRKAKLSIVNESGLYNLVFQSRTTESKKFKKWVTRDVLPQIRKTGMFALPGANLPAFVRRFNDNWDRVDAGYFSVISELFIRIYGRFEQLGHPLAEKGPDGKEIRPDVSVGKTFSTWLKEFHPSEKDNHKPYKHLINGIEVPARQYPYAMWPLFSEFVDTVWMRDHAPNYLQTRDPIALEMLPKLLPPPDPKANERVVATSRFHQVKETVLKSGEGK